MKLNTTSYVHIKIRQLCLQIELLSGMKLITNLSEEFDEVRFMNDYGYIVIDWEKDAVYSLSHHINDKEMATIEDIMLYLRWLSWGVELEQERRKNKKKNL